MDHDDDQLPPNPTDRIVADLLAYADALAKSGITDLPMDVTLTFVAIDGEAPDELVDRLAAALGLEVSAYTSGDDRYRVAALADPMTRFRKGARARVEASRGAEPAESPA